MNTHDNFALFVDQARNAIASLEDAASNCPQGLPDLLGSITLSPALLAQILMNHVDGPLAKGYWLAVAEAMGPDHIESLDKATAFMDVVSEF